MNVGNIRCFDHNKGYGFIDHIDGREIYFHYTSILEKDKIGAGCRVHFDLYETRLGWEAGNVRTGF